MEFLGLGILWEPQHALQACCKDRGLTPAPAMRPGADARTRSCGPGTFDAACEEEALGPGLAHAGGRSRLRCLGKASSLVGFGQVCATGLARADQVASASQAKRNDENVNANIGRQIQAPWFG